ncbi:hypothetical protein GUITHDRAFT_154021 [Guillardia theta CCMP2712]|uniref:Uncharacterized protein n=1 Tax=Guillardia theta (strain CCMP2712) TaxID=905079 RepID=L1IYE2_GUITC|nr:hypothetical protein GUITHDRAFT_154021 [Guillardia theta CCMP2712]EKX40835.1 hypothetical protein GUITHDRAFT_154021 [Guillardia theta CCMP2712]|eukprot:XP_005827815.1 hypothetical protein GUITHDRAFT_154021 [Guillardia theta CCMP2712]
MPQDSRRGCGPCRNPLALVVSQKVASIGNLSQPAEERLQEICMAFFGNNSNR